MSEQIYRQIQTALDSGKVIQAIKLLRQVEDLDLRSAKDRIETMVSDMRNGQRDNPYTQARSDSDMLEASSRPRAHSHTPARSGEYNVESDLPTEAFLFLQKGEVAEALRVIQEAKGLKKNSAKRLAKMFYQQHPEYTSKEISRFMSTTVSNSNTSTLAKTSNSKASKSKKKKSTGLFEIIFFLIIFVNIVRACAG